MPQFDFFIWISLSFWTILTFQFLYYILLYYILAPFANLQKTLIKLYNLKFLKQEQKNVPLFHQLAKMYFQSLKNAKTK